MLKGRPLQQVPPPQNRTCRTTASGSSSDGFAKPLRYPCLFRCHGLGSAVAFPVSPIHGSILRRIPSLLAGSLGTVRQLPIGTMNALRLPTTLGLRFVCHFALAARLDRFVRSAASNGRLASAGSCSAGVNPSGILSGRLSDLPSSHETLAPARLAPDRLTPTPCSPTPVKPPALIITRARCCP